MIHSQIPVLRDNVDERLDDCGAIFVLVGIRRSVEAIAERVHAFRRLPLGGLDAPKCCVFRRIEVGQEAAP